MVGPNPGLVSQHLSSSQKSTSGSKNEKCKRIK